MIDYDPQSNSKIELCLKIASNISSSFTYLSRSNIKASVFIDDIFFFVAVKSRLHFQQTKLFLREKGKWHKF